METLTAFVRERAPWPPAGTQAGLKALEESQPGAEPCGPDTDIQAVLTVLGRRSKARRKQGQEEGRRLNLKNSDLRRAQLQHACLEHADFDGACLQRANFKQAHLEEVSLYNANLWRAIFIEANLEGAYLWEVCFSYVLLGMAHLEKAHLVDAKFDKTLLAGAHLDGTKLMGADLRDAVGLSEEQLKYAIGDKGTELPGHIAPPGHWLEQGLKARAADSSKG